MKLLLVVTIDRLGDLNCPPRVSVQPFYSQRHFRRQLGLYIFSSFGHCEWKKREASFHVIVLHKLVKCACLCLITKTQDLRQNSIFTRVFSEYTFILIEDT
jgi:hypothetical protein